jgi:hypothetical protein
MVDEQDIGGWVETGDGVEWDVDGVVERDTEAVVETVTRKTLMLLGVGK